MVTRRLQAERRTGSVRRPKTGVPPTVLREQDVQSINLEPRRPLASFIVINCCLGSTHNDDDDDDVKLPMI